MSKLDRLLDAFETATLTCANANSEIEQRQGRQQVREARAELIHMYTHNEPVCTIDMSKLLELLERHACFAVNYHMSSTTDNLNAMDRVRHEILSYVAQSTKLQNEPFDETAARAGRAIQANFDDDWINVHFVGTNSVGAMVIESSGNMWVFATSKLRMKPREMKTYYVNVYKSGSIETFSDNEDEVRRAASSNCIAIAYPIQVPV